MCAHNCMRHCELCAAMCVKIILFPARQFIKFSGIVRSIVCGNVRSQLCEALWIVCGNVAWFGMVGRKRLYERKKVMVWSGLTNWLTRVGIELLGQLKKPFNWGNFTPDTSAVNPNNRGFTCFVVKTNSRDLRVFGVKFWTHIFIHITKMTLCNSAEAAEPCTFRTACNIRTRPGGP